MTEDLYASDPLDRDPELMEPEELDALWPVEVPPARPAAGGGEAK
jgi:hypothetical protein